jgi:hypothetical protein
MLARFGRWCWVEEIDCENLTKGELLADSKSNCKQVPLRYQQFDDSIALGDFDEAVVCVNKAKDERVWQAG